MSWKTLYGLPSSEPSEGETGEQRVPFPGLNNEILGIFTDAECVEAYHRNLEAGMTRENAVRKFQREKKCSLCLVIEVLINAGERLPTKWMRLADPEYGMKPKKPKKPGVRSMRVMGDEALSRIPEWAIRYTLCEGSAEMGKFIRQAAAEQDRSPYDIADDLIGMGFPVQKLYTREMLEKKREWGHEGGSKAAEVIREMRKRT